MKEYRVSWEIEIPAMSPEDAARQALAIQRDPKSLAVVFNVSCPDGETRRIDLLGD